MALHLPEGSPYSGKCGHLQHLTFSCIPCERHTVSLWFSGWRLTDLTEVGFQLLKHLCTAVSLRWGHEEACQVLESSAEQISGKGWEACHSQK